MAFMIIVYIATLLVLGVLGLLATGGLPGAAAAAEKQVNELAAKIAPFTGIIGIVGIVIGLMALLSFIGALSIIAYTPVWVLTAGAAAVCLIALGLISAYPLIAKAIGGNKDAEDAAAKALAAVKPFQRPLSFAAVAVGALYLVLYLLTFARIAF
jgi:hypothetical protein